MNKWVEKSIRLANSNGYLDKLFEVYPVNLNLNRSIPDELKENIQIAFDRKDKKELIKELLKFTKFPIDDPYVASLRRYSHLLDKNPETINRLGDRLLLIGIENIIKMAAKPKSSSRQFGNIFQNWLNSFQYPILSQEEFSKCKRISFLKGSDNELKKFAKSELKIKKLNRRPDFILKTRSKFVLGEAKFLTDYGGTQNNQFDNALKITKIKGKNYEGIAVLDGIVWFDSNNYMNKKIKRFRNNALSALLLKEFMKN